MSKFFSKDGGYLGLSKKNFTSGKKNVIFEGRRNISERKKMRKLKEEYNGWTNYETWNVNLHLDNEGYYDFLREEAASYEEAYEFGDYIKSFVEDELLYKTLESLKGMAGDLLKASLRMVNWREIAEQYIDKKKNKNTVVSKNRYGGIS